MIELQMIWQGPTGVNPVFGYVTTGQELTMSETCAYVYESLGLAVKKPIKKASSLKEEKE